MLLAQTFLPPILCSGIVTVVDSKYGLQHLEEVKPDGMVNEAVR